MHVQHSYLLKSLYVLEYHVTKYHRVPRNKGMKTQRQQRWFYGKRKQKEADNLFMLFTSYSCKVGIKTEVTIQVTVFGDIEG